jgi:hypothetical protein
MSHLGLEQPCWGSDNLLSWVVIVFVFVSVFVALALLAQSLGLHLLWPADMFQR